MLGMSISDFVAWSLAVILALTGLVQLAGLRFVRQAYENWEYPRGIHRVAGSLEIVAAAFLVMSPTRVWGVALAGMILFVAVVTLLSHRQYLAALPGMIMMAALVPALLPATV
jgi:hypothetical protein